MDKILRSRSLQQGHRSNQNNNMMLHTYIPKPMLLPISLPRSLQKGQRSNQDYTMTLATYKPKTMPLPSINFLHLTVSEIEPKQDVQTAHLHPQPMSLPRIHILDLRVS